MNVTPELKKSLLAVAKRAAATHARVIPLSGLELHESVRGSCAANSCGRYGVTWTCPPGVGGLDELRERISGFPTGLLIQNIGELEDSWDFEGMTAAMESHNAIMRRLGSEVQALLPEREVLVLGAGGCRICEKCTYPDAPCVRPEAAISSVEGYGMDIRILVESHGLKYINGVNTVSYVGMVLIG